MFAFLLNFCVNLRKYLHSLKSVGLILWGIYEFLCLSSKFFKMLRTDFNVLRGKAVVEEQSVKFYDGSGYVCKFQVFLFNTLMINMVKGGMRSLNTL